MKILLVEDDDSTRMLLEFILQKRGHEVHTCVDAESAWEAYLADPYPLILLDWVLAGMTGLELCRKVRSYPHGDRSLILVVTSRDQPEDLQAVMDAGADDYIKKPLDIDLFRIRLTIAERNVLHMQERKKAEDRLRSMSSRLATLIQNLQAGILVEDENRRIAIANQDFCTMFELVDSPSEIVGTQSEDLLNKSVSLFKTPEKTLQRMKDIVRNNVLLTGNELILKNGRILDFDYIPIVLDESFQGFLWQFRDITDRRYAEIELLQAREREVEISSKIQHTLLLGIPPDDLDRVRMNALTLASQRVDGDFYDFVKYNPHCVDVIIGDVMGKGITAALLGAATKSHFQRAIGELLTQSPHGRLPQPEEIVTLVHQKITPQLMTLESFITLIYARFDMEKNQCQFVNCGHPSIIHRHARSSTCSLLEGLNMPLGVIEWEEYRQVTVDVESGDFFFFYSDGVTEAMNEHHEQFGEKRLIQFFSEKANQHPRHILDQIRKQVVDFSQSESFADDFTCIGVAITEPGINFTLDRNSVQFTSSPYELSAIRRAVVQFCRQNYPLDIESDSLNALVLAVVEASTNIMRHSYHGDTTKLLVMELEAYDHGVLIRLIHEGMTFDPDGYPDPKLEDIGPGGMGLFIIRQCVDDVRYYQDAFGRQCVDLRKTMN